MSIDWSRVKHFERSEFGHSKGVDPDSKLVEMLDEARTIAGVLFNINSGIRTKARNAEVGGKPNSAHIGGYAVDIECRTSRHRFLMTRALLEVGFTRIGWGESFIHVDTDPTKPQSVGWLY